MRTMPQVLFLVTAAVVVVPDRGVRASDMMHSVDCVAS